MGVLELSETLANKVDSATPLTSGSTEEIELRATAIIACDEIAKKAKSKFTNTNNNNEVLFYCMQLDYYLWTIGKDEKFRTVERHYTLDTVFY